MVIPGVFELGGPLGDILVHFVRNLTGRGERLPFLQPRKWMVEGHHVTTTFPEIEGSRRRDMGT